MPALPQADKKLDWQPFDDAIGEEVLRRLEVENPQLFEGIKAMVVQGATPEQVKARFKQFLPTWEGTGQRLKVAMNRLKGNGK